MTPPLKLFGFSILFTVLNNVCNVSCKSPLILTNDGPAVIGGNITFLARLLKSYSHLMFTFDDGIQKLTFPAKNLNVSLTVAFPSDKYEEGLHRMKVTVRGGLIEREIASNYTDFDLKNFLIGEIHVHQGNGSTNKSVEKVAVAENFTAVVDFYDPNNFLKDAVIDYSWSFDMDLYFTTTNLLVYNFSDVGEKIIIVKPKATFPDSRSITGFFTKNLSVRVPVNHVVVSGNPFLHHGDLLKLNVSCFGTPPFTYCSEILKENTTIDNFTCTQVSVFTTCHMEIIKFLTDGKYQIGIYIGNDVREFKKVMEIMVYSVTIKPILSAIIIPTICSFLTLIIIVIGISFYIRQKKQFAVEVADFDFQDESDSYIGERTFFGKLFDSFACRNCGGRQWSCVKDRTESDPLLNDDSFPDA